MDHIDGIPDWGVPSEDLARLASSDSASSGSDGGVALLPSPELPPLDPKHKAAILYFMFFASVAASSNTSVESSTVFCSYAQFAASEFCEKVYNINLHPDHIREYYHQIDLNAREVFGVNMDQKVIAHYLRLYVPHKDTFNDITSFAGLLRVSLASSTSFFSLLLTLLMAGPRTKSCRSGCSGLSGRHKRPVEPPALSLPTNLCAPFIVKAQRIPVILNYETLNSSSAT